MASPSPASLFDFGLYFFHNAQALLERGTGPYFYLPKMESHLEARLWNDVFVLAQDQLGIPQGTIKATVLIETILAAFEMDEILYELRDHSAGLNCGRWDYIFSAIKKRRNDPDVHPARPRAGDDDHAFHALVFAAAHPDVPSARRARDGRHGGPDSHQERPRRPTRPRWRRCAPTKSAKPTTATTAPGSRIRGWCRSAMTAFDARDAAGQPDRPQARGRACHRRLICWSFPKGRSPRQGCAPTSASACSTWKPWLRGLACVPLYNLMEDAATAEISRAQVWQWIRHPQGVLTDGRKVTIDLFRQILAEELEKIKASVGAENYAARHFQQASEIFDRLTTADQFGDFLTLPAYEYID